jgi:dTDP-glucose 4,6-dehydratase
MSRGASLLVTGGAGFIGSNFIRHYLAEHQESEVVNLDKLTYAGNLSNLADLEGNPRYRFVRGDIADRRLVKSLLAEVSPQAIVNFAAESHVDRSILDASPFVDTNVGGTLVLLEAACAAWPKGREDRRFIQISTDEVYGDLARGCCATEESPLAPSNPYSASKASADLLCGAFFRTYRLPVIVTRCTNNYGPYQFPEKVIPLMILKASRAEKLPVYGDGLNIRDWIHVSDHCLAIETVLLRGRPGTIYNIGTGCEKQNIEIVRSILLQLGQSEDLIEYVQDRPGHDRRYALDTSKVRAELGWTPKMGFAEGLRDTMHWYQDHPEWVQSCLTREYMRYCEANYVTTRPHAEGKLQS